MILLSQAEIFKEKFISVRAVVLKPTLVYLPLSYAKQIHIDAPQGVLFAQCYRPYYIPRF